MLSEVHGDQCETDAASVEGMDSKSLIRRTKLICIAVALLIHSIIYSACLERINVHAVEPRY